MEAACAALARLAVRTGELLGAAVFSAALTAVYFLVITPTALLYRLCSGDALRLRRPPPGGSMYRPGKGRYSGSDLEKPW